MICLVEEQYAKFFVIQIPKDGAQIGNTAGRIVKLDFLYSLLRFAAAAQFGKGKDTAGFGPTDAGNPH
jgi:hypothetical protein